MSYWWIKIHQYECQFGDNLCGRIVQNAQWSFGVVKTGALTRITEKQILYNGYSSELISHFFTFLWISKTEKKQTNFFFMFFMSFLKEYFTCKTFGMDTVWTWKSNHKNNWIIYTNNKLWRELTVHFKKKNEIYLPLEIGRQFLLMYWMSFCIWLFDLGKIWYLYCLRVVEHLQHFRPAQKKL
jgi:hypothetical protein